MLDKKMASVMLLCIGAALYGLDLASTSSNDVVSDQEAASVVGGMCFCVVGSNCGDPETGCTGYGLTGGGICQVKAESLTNPTVCGGGCADFRSEKGSGCASS